MSRNLGCAGVVITSFDFGIFFLAGLKKQILLDEVLQKKNISTVPSSKTVIAPFGHLKKLRLSFLLDLKRL